MREPRVLQMARASGRGPCAQAWCRRPRSWPSEGGLHCAGAQTQRTGGQGGPRWRTASEALWAPVLPAGPSASYFWNLALADKSDALQEHHVTGRPAGSCLCLPGHRSPALPGVGPVESPCAGAPEVGGVLLSDRAALRSRAPSLFPPPPESVDVLRSPSCVWGPEGEGRLEEARASAPACPVSLPVCFPASGGGHLVQSVAWGGLAAVIFRVVPEML